MDFQVEGGDVDDQCLPFVDQLVKLKGLHLTKTNVRGNSLATLKRIQNFKRVTFSSGLQTSALLKA
ncbi:MAG: hypothetical protein ACMG6E_10680, partial [Candidatus Roizmanbacteria bacterium]